MRVIAVCLRHFLIPPQSVVSKTADVSSVVASSLLGKGAGSAFDPGLSLLDEKLAKSRMVQQAKEKEWKATVTKIASDWEEGIAPEGLGEPGEGYDTVNGVRVPPSVHGVAAVSFMLTQRKGALKPKDLAAAIAKKQLERTRQELEQGKLRAAQGALRVSLFWGWTRALPH